MQREDIQLRDGRFITAEVTQKSDDGTRGRAFVKGPGAGLQEQLANGREIKVVKFKRIWKEETK